MLALYLFIMADLLFRYNVILDVRREMHRSLNLIPFHTIRAYLGGGYPLRGTAVVSNILGNIVVFIPCGLFLQVIRKRKTFWMGVLAVAVAACAVEALQYAFGLGASDIDDVILNTCGGAIGVLLYALFRKLFRNEARTRAAITVAALVVGLPVAYLYFTTVFAHLRL